MVAQRKLHGHIPPRAGHSSPRRREDDSVRCSVVLHCICIVVLYCIVLYCIVLYCIVLYCIVLYCIVLYCIVLYCSCSHFTQIRKSIRKKHTLPAYKMRLGSIIAIHHNINIPQPRSLLPCPQEAHRHQACKSSSEHTTFERCPCYWTTFENQRVFRQ